MAGLTPSNNITPQPLGQRADMVISKTILQAISMVAFAISGLVASGLIMVMWFLVLKTIQASTLLWVLYWGYVPLVLFSQIVMWAIKAWVKDMGEDVNEIAQELNRQ